MDLMGLMGRELCEYVYVYVYVSVSVSVWIYLLFRRMDGWGLFIFAILFGSVMWQRSYLYQYFVLETTDEVRETRCEQ